MLVGNLCPRQTIFERQYGYYEQPTRLWWAVRGTLLHAVVETVGETLRSDGWFHEMRMSVDLEFPEQPAPIFDADGVFTGEFDTSKHLVITLGGTTDCYSPLVRELWDTKTLADRKVVMLATSGKIEEKWTQQTNIYRWLVSQTPMPADIAEEFGLVGTHYPAPDKLFIQGLSMMYLPRSGMATEVKVPQPGSRYEAKGTFEIDDVPVMPLDDIEVLIRREALKWYRWLVLGELPPVVRAKDKWLCDSCSFNGEIVANGPCFPTRERVKRKAAA